MLNYMDNIISGTEHAQRELERRIFHLKTLYDLGQEIGFLRCTNTIVKNLLLMVMGTLGVSRGVVLLADTTSNKVEAFAQRGLGDAFREMSEQGMNSGYLNDLRDIEGVISVSKEAGRQGTEVKGFLDLLFLSEIVIWVPFKINERLIGGIGLGDKILGDPYTTDDQELLSTLAHHGAMAIENAKFVEQMKKEEVVRTNLARYLSPQIVEKIIHKGMHVNLGGHKSVVSVLFSDIRNFTIITETLPPDQLVSILNEYFTEMAGIIFENQGSLDKFIGDAIVAVFGSLVPLDNPSNNAVSAAIQMMRRMPVLNEKWKERYGINMSIGIGINTGEVFMGNIGSPDRMEFTVIGDAVNVASRFSGLAKPGQILLTRETVTCISPDIACKELPPCEVKGKTGKLEVFEILK